jgi:hypothetical protein
MVKRPTRRTKGGFYPSVMGGVIRNGPLFITAAVAQASRLIRGSKRSGSSRKRTRRRTKRTRR